MVFPVILCLTVTCLIPACYLIPTPARYECGAHGKFEYCIDGIPGCVVGCHCHPGYYFDTETKICEPNIKLAQDFRRHYDAEPTRVSLLYTPTMADYYPTPTTPSSLNENIENVETQDDDDIGDWLYHQFFKTIETQVINNTSDKPTRRAGENDEITESQDKPKDDRKDNSRKGNHGGSRKKLKRKSRKSFRGKGKKKKSKSHGLRRKLLRISEDDSLFESDSDSDSDDSSDSESSESESSSESREKPSATEHSEHGHKKVLIFNRRPRPPLPSFIFLPSGDTPYYPPIGLPPPPMAMPMYPMAPIPPMAPIFPFTIETENTSSCTTTSSTQEVTHTTNTETTASIVTSESPTTEEPETIPPDTTTDSPPILRSGKHNRPKKNKRLPPMGLPEDDFFYQPMDETGMYNNNKKSERMKLVQKLKERLRMQNKVPPISDNYANFPDEDPSRDEFPVQDTMPLNTPTQNETFRSHRDRNQHLKYISQLIHRVNFSDPKQPQLQNNIKSNLNLGKLPQTRRNYQLEPQPIQIHNEMTGSDGSYLQEPNEIYFANLGRQIASLIRNADLKSRSNVPMKQNQEENLDSVINQNGDASRSYWERTVRSPLTKLKIFDDLINSYKQSNEMNLLSLENEVKTFAITESPLSLQDLENILSTLQYVQNDIRDTKKHIKQSNRGFNVNLLPIKPVRRFNSRPLPINYTPEIKKVTIINNLDKYGKKINDTFNGRSLNSVTGINELPTTSKKESKGNRSLELESFYESKRSKIIPYSIERKNAPKKSNKEYFKFYKKYTQPKASEYAQAPARHPVKGVQYPFMGAIYPERQGKFTELPPTYLEDSVKYVDMSPKYLKQSAKYVDTPDSSKNPHDLPEKIFMLPGKYPGESNEWSRRSPERSTMVNYESFSEVENKHHYNFDFMSPVYKKSFSKRFESDKPSYFHDDLHEFD